ncbi:MAG: hypothetical protein P4L61_03145 [Candidatus Pacebacteria bacterium]|nr:hypothetical protein [Candidatus Paceibacterota bacterium]
MKKHILTGGAIVVVIAVIDTLFMTGHSLQWLSDVPFLGSVLLFIGLFLQIPVGLIAYLLPSLTNNVAIVWSIVIIVSFITGALLGWIYGQVKSQKSNATS